MGLAFTSGIRLCSTVLAVGPGIRLGFLQLTEWLSHLQVLATRDDCALEPQLIRPVRGNRRRLS